MHSIGWLDFFISFVSQSGWTRIYCLWFKCTKSRCWWTRALYSYRSCEWFGRLLQARKTLRRESPERADRRRTEEHILPFSSLTDYSIILLTSWTTFSRQLCPSPSCGSAPLVFSSTRSLSRASCLRLDTLQPLSSISYIVSALNISTPIAFIPHLGEVF